MKTKTKHQQKFKLSSFADFIFYCATTDWLCFVFPTILPPAGGYCAPAGARVHARAGLVVAGRPRRSPQNRPFFCPPRFFVRRSLLCYNKTMAKVTYLQLPEGLETSFASSLKLGDRFTFGRIVLNRTLLSKKRKIDIAQRSLLSQIAVFWHALTDEQRTAWSTAADEVSLTGWQLFVQDQAARLGADLSGTATPEVLHQSWVGEVSVADFSDEFFAIQLHPNAYYIKRKIKGTKSQYESVKITEWLRLPLQIGINYKADLEAGDGDYSACFFADVNYSYQGVDKVERLQIDFDLQTDWKTASATLSAILGQYSSYNLFLYFKNVTGIIWFDHFVAYHSGQNWAIDPFCKNLTQLHTRNFYQIPAEWFIIDLTSGVAFDSVYQDT